MKVKFLLAILILSIIIVGCASKVDMYKEHQYNKTNQRASEAFKELN